MKKIILHKMSVPLGSAINYITEDEKWLYLVPSSTLIPNLKNKILNKNPNLLKNLKITTFDQLMRILMTNDHLRMLSQSEQEFILKKAIDIVNMESGFTYFGSSIEKQGWLFKVGVWLGEIKRSGVTSDELQKIWRSHSAKYRELANIYQTYQEILKKNFLIDHEEPYLNFLADNKSISKLFDYYGIIIEQFYDFSPIQIKVLNKLGNNGIEIINHLAIDDNRTELFQSSYKTIRYLEKLGFKSEVSNSFNEKGELSTLFQIKKTIFSLSPIKIDAEDSINLIETSGREQEVKETAVTIKSLVINNKSRLDEIAIIVPQLQKYYEHINNIMSKAGIPIRISRKEYLINNPYIQSVISLLKAFSGQRKEWINIIFSPYFIWSKTIEPSYLMNIYRELAYPMSRDIWEERFNRYKQKGELEKEKLQFYDEAMKKIFDLMELAPRKGINKDFFQFINLVEKELQIKDNIKTYLINNINSMSAFRDFKAFEKWQELKSNLLSIEQLFSNSEKVTLWVWINSLINACEKIEYDFTQGKNEGVFLLQPNQIMGRSFSAVFVLGLVEGEFPKPIKNDWLLPDIERYFLNQKGYMLNYSLDYVYNQKYQFFQSVAAANDKLYLVYSAGSEEGKEYLKSYYIEECLNVLINDTIKTKVLKLSDMVPSEWNSSINDDHLINKIYYELSKSNNDPNKTKEAIERLRFYQLKLPNKIDSINVGIISEIDRSNNLKSAYDGILSDENNLSEISEYINNKVWSTTQLNRVNQCRFAYFAQDIIKLTKWKEPEESLSAIEKGDIFHRILQRFFDKYRNDSNVINSELIENYYEEVINIAKEEWELFKNQGNRIIDSVLSDIDWNRLKQNVKEIINLEIGWRKKSMSYFFPKYLELSFGLPIKENIKSKLVDPNSIEKKLELPLQNKSILLSGKIDRVDINKEGQFVIYDYKTGNIPDNKQIKEGINLQLHIYLFVLEYLFKFDREKAIGAGFYTINENRNRGIWKNSLVNQIGLSSKVNTIDDREWNDYLDMILVKIEELITVAQSGDFAVLPNIECPSYCAFKQICRKDEKKIKEKIRVRSV